VEDSEIAALQAIVASGLSARPWSYFSVGQKVCIEYGALAGVEGILIAVKGSSKLVVSVRLLQRSVAVEIDEAWVAPLAIPFSLRPQAAACSPKPNSNSV
jgi:transcription antitermination factor NusG